MTREEVEEALTQALVPYFVDPKVQVNVKKRKNPLESTTFQPR
jgi:hypothetical protein